MTIECPFCKSELSNDQITVGRRVQCPDCGEKFTVEESYEKCLIIPKSDSGKYLRVAMIVVCGVALAVLCGIIGVRFLPSDRKVVAEVDNDQMPTNAFSYVKDKLVTLTLDEVQGSGFVLAMGPKKYLVTNEHVVRAGNGKKPRALLLNGDVLEIGECEVAKDRDLIRFELPSNAVAMQMSREIPEIGKGVVVYGNSDGGGVSTQIAGKILGVGGDKLEIDAMFVNGNSGSPVVNERGYVDGVATYLTNFTNANNWVKKDTRYNGVRRYATRLVNMPWMAIRWDEYSRQVTFYNDLEYFLSRFSPFLRAFYEDVPSDDLCYSDIEKVGYNSYDSLFHPILMNVKNAYAALMKTCDTWERLSKEKNGFADYLKGKDENVKQLAVREYDAVTREALAELVENVYEFNRSKYQALQSAKDALLQAKITLPLLKTGGEDATGTERYYKAIEFEQAAIAEKYLQSSNAVEFADKLMLSKKKADRELGFVLLSRMASKNDTAAIDKCVDCIERGDFDDGVLGVRKMPECLKKTLEASFAKGKRKLGYILGCITYSESNYAETEKYWIAAADADSEDAMCALATFYYFALGNGGSPRTMRSERKAKEVLLRLCIKDVGYKYTAMQLLLAHICMTAQEKILRDYAKAHEIYSALSEINYENTMIKKLEGVSFVLNHVSRIAMAGGFYLCSRQLQRKTPRLLSDCNDCSFTFDLRWMDEYEPFCDSINTSKYKTECEQRIKDDLAAIDKDEFIKAYFEHVIESPNKEGSDVISTILSVMGGDGFVTICDSIFAKCVREVLIAKNISLLNEKKQNPKEIGSIGDYFRLLNDPGNAFYAYKSAATQNDGYAQYRLAQMYQFGESVTANSYESFNWFMKSAIRGYPYAQIVIGDLSKKPNEKIDWFVKAAESGVPMAQYYAAFYSDLMGWGAWQICGGVFYNNVWSMMKVGRRCDFPDDEEDLNKLWGVKDERSVAKFRADALKWYRKASDNGISDAAEALKMHKVSVSQ